MRPRDAFAELVARPDDEVDLARAALLIAASEYVDLEVDRYLFRLDEWGRELRTRVGTGAGPEDVHGALGDLLFAQQGFHGNTKDYYDPRNSFLNEVLDRRTGIPITLSAVYIEVAQRAGVAVAGVSLPGHFIVRLGPPQAGLLVDPFHAGVRLSEADCQKRLDRIYEGKMKLSPSMLAACGPRAMLTRMLRNLKVIYVKRGDLLRAVSATELLLLVTPEVEEERRDRGMLYGALDCYAWAVRDLSAYLAGSPRAKDTASVEAKLAELKRKATSVN